MPAESVTFSAEDAPLLKQAAADLRSFDPGGARAGPLPDDPAPFREDMLHLYHEIEQAKAEVEFAQEALRAKKQHHKALQEKLESRIREEITPGRLPFVRPLGAEGWRDVPLATALRGVSEAVLELLAEASLTTLGELSEFTRTRPLTDVPGIGESKAETIISFLDRYWAEHPKQD